MTMTMSAKKIINDSNRIFNKILNRDWFSAPICHVGVQLQVSKLDFL